MARTARLFVENACHHIITRGVNKDIVFREESEFDFYYNLLHKYKTKFGCLVYSYCLMRNHAHLVIESPCGIKAMSYFMHGISQSYAMYFNQKHNRVGHLWQNRYKNFVVAKDEYLINLLSYVEANPIRAGFVLKPEDYRWSSYQGRVLGRKDIIIDPLNIG